MDSAGVDKSIVYADVNEEVYKMVEPYRDRFILFARVHLNGDIQKATSDLEYCVGSLGFKGIGEIFPTGSHFDMSDFNRLDAFFSRAIELDIPISWDLKEGAKTNIEGRYRSLFSGFSKMQEICFRYPESKHIICHSGGLDHYVRALSTLSYYKNVYFDLSELSSSLIWKFMTPTWKIEFPSGIPRELGLLLSFLYPEKSDYRLANRDYVKDKVGENVVDIFREAANMLPDRILFASDSPVVGRMDFEREFCQRAFGHDRALLKHVLGGNAERLLGI